MSPFDMNRRIAMVKREIALALLFFAPLELSAQRYRRPDGIQIYGRVERVLI
jgi:hypothetical protein